MKIICSDINIFKASFEAISKIVNEVGMEIDSDGIRVDAIDPGHTTFIHLDLKKEEFDIFDVDEPKKIHFTTDEFVKYLKRINKDSLLELSVEPTYLIIHSEGITNKTFKLKLIDSDDTIPELPSIDYPTSFEMETKLFKEICSDIIEFSEKLKISNEKEIIKFVAYGDFTDAEIEYDNGIKPGDDCESVYDLTKIKDMLKADKFAKNSIIKYGTDMPILYELKSDDGNQCLSFMLTPRIEEDY